MNPLSALEIDYTGGIPVWIQIKNRIAYLIGSGEFSAGDRLPTVRGLAVDLDVSYNTVNRAYMDLEREGYIRGYHAEVNLEKLGYGIKAFILITVKPEDNKEFYEFVRQERCILECNHITGNYSMILKTVFSSTTLLDEFLGRLQRFGKTETHVVFSTLMERY